MKEDKPCNLPFLTNTDVFSTISSIENISQDFTHIHTHKKQKTKFKTFEIIKLKSRFFFRCLADTVHPHHSFYAGIFRGCSENMKFTSNIGPLRWVSYDISVQTQKVPVLYCLSAITGTRKSNRLIGFDNGGLWFKPRSYNQLISRTWIKWHYRSSMTMTL